MNEPDLAVTAGEMVGEHGVLERHEERAARDSKGAGKGQERPRSRSRERDRIRSALRLTIFRSAELCGAMHVASRVSQRFSHQTHIASMSRNALRQALMEGAPNASQLRALWDNAATEAATAAVGASYADLAWDAVTDLTL